MKNLNQLTQAYTQAPWRKQMQMIGMILLILVCVAIIAGIYLNVTARAAAVGRQIQEMQVRVYGYHYLTGDGGEDYVPIEELEQNIASLNAKLAYLTSYQVVQERAKELGLQPVDADHVMYVQVPGYIERQTASLAPPPEPVIVSAPSVNPQFKESLFDWLGNEIRQTAKYFSEVQP